MKRFHTDAKSVTFGNNRGIGTLPHTNLTIATVAVMTTKTTARAIDKAEVYRKESAGREQELQYELNSNILLDGYE